MRTRAHMISSILFFLSLGHFVEHLVCQPSTEGFACPVNQTTYPCQTYAFYRAKPPNFLDLASIGDLFSVSRLMISNPSNISSPSSPLLPDQPLLIPLSCSCNTVNSSTGVSYSYANLSYTIKKGDTFYLVSTTQFQNLTTYQAVQAVNPNLIPTLLDIGQDVIFPVFCKCPNETQLGNKVKFMISYVFQGSDDLSGVGSLFGVKPEAIVDVNGGKIQPLDTIFIPVNELPGFSQPLAPQVPPVRGKERKGLIIGLAVGLGVVGGLLILILGFVGYREGKLNRRERGANGENQRLQFYKGGKGLSEMEANLMADVSDCLDKYRVFKIDELREATNGFSGEFLIQGSVYRGCINGEEFAIKKMNWNAYEELKILQKVNHGNLVKLEGFCIDPNDASCYLIYEYIENGSLNSWLHGKNNRKLNWKTRLNIAIDIANGLQYIHEHTRPRVVHKDIKSSNILLDSNMRAKIANFGLAKSGFNAITTHIVGTQGYIAPEYLADGVVSTKMDVFSFGVVLLELVSGEEVIGEEGRLLWAIASEIWERREKRLEGWIDRSLLEESFSMESVVNVMGVAMACLHRDPLKRPSMVEIVYALCKDHDFFFDFSEDGLADPLLVAR